MRHFVNVLVLIFVVAASVSVTNGIKCYVDDLDHQWSNCSYCGFANITTYTNYHGTFTLDYKCLPTANLTVKDFKVTNVNSCKESSFLFNGNGNGGKLCLCDSNLCNTGTDVRAGFGFAAVLSILSAIFLIK